MHWLIWPSVFFLMCSEFQFQTNLLSFVHHQTLTGNTAAQQEFTTAVDIFAVHPPISHFLSADSIMARFSFLQGVKISRVSFCFALSGRFLWLGSKWSHTNERLINYTCGHCLWCDVILLLVIQVWAETRRRVLSLNVKLFKCRFDKLDLLIWQTGPQRE